MRPTFLHFRNPAQRTPEYRINNVTHTSQRLSYAEKNKQIQEYVSEDGSRSKSPIRSTSPPQNKHGQNFSRADRFNYEERFYCNNNG